MAVLCLRIRYIYASFRTRHVRMNELGRHLNHTTTVLRYYRRSTVHHPHCKKRPDRRLRVMTHTHTQHAATIPRYHIQLLRVILAKPKTWTLRSKRLHCCFTVPVAYSSSHYFRHELRRLAFASLVVLLLPVVPSVRVPYDWHGAFVGHQELLASL